MIRKWVLPFRKAIELIVIAGVDIEYSMPMVCDEPVTVYEFDDHAAIPLVCRLDIDKFRRWIESCG